MDFSSFLTSLGTSFAIFVILMFLFTLLARQKGNAVIYYPNKILQGLDLQSTRNPFEWINEAISSTEAEILRVSGVDSAVYFVFLTTVLGILVFSAIFLLPVLLPVAYTEGSVWRRANDTTSVGSFNDLDRLSMGHIKQKSPRLWAFLVGVYWVSFVTYCHLWKAYNHVADLRAAALLSPEVKPEQFAVLVRDIPKVDSKGKSSIKEHVDSYFMEIYPDTFYRSMVITNMSKVNKIYKQMEGYKKKLARAEAKYAESKTDDSNSEGTRPTTKTGLLGLIGPKVDKIEYYTEKIKDLIPILEAERKVTLKDKQQRAAIVFFNSRIAAASASQSLHDKIVDSWTVMAAPEARDMIWPNLRKRFYEREIQQYMIYFVVFLTIFFYIIPAGFISAFTTLAYLDRNLPFLKPVLEQTVIRTALGAYLPQLVLLIVLAILPMFLLFLSRAEGIPSESHAQRAASGKFFYFAVLNVFLGVTLGQSLFTTLKTVQDKPVLIIPLLGSSLPGSASFFLTFVALKFFVIYGFRLSRVIPFIIFHLKKRFICKTEAEVKEAWAPGGLGFAIRFPADMLIVTICICYSVIAPLIIPFGVVYFGLGWLVMRNEVLNVLVPSYETYGRIWPHIYKRIMASLILFQITMLGYFSIKQFIYTTFMIPLPILSFIFAFVCNKKHYRFFQSTALLIACQEPNEKPDMEAIFRSYIPPALRSDDIADEDQSIDALSRVPRAAEQSASSTLSNLGASCDV